MGDRPTGDTPAWFEQALWLLDVDLMKEGKPKQSSMATASARGPTRETVKALEPTLIRGQRQDSERGRPELLAMASPLPPVIVGAISHCHSGRADSSHVHLHDKRLVGEAGLQGEEAVGYEWDAGLATPRERDIDDRLHIRDLLHPARHAEIGPCFVQLFKADPQVVPTKRVIEEETRARFVFPQEPRPTRREVAREEVRAPGRKAIHTGSLAGSHRRMNTNDQAVR